MTSALIEKILSNKISDQSFALLYRPSSTGINRIEILVGEVYELDTLNSIPLPKLSDTSIHNNALLVLIPYKQLKERNFDYIDDDATLMVMKVTHYETISMTEAFRILPHLAIKLSEGVFDISDDSYIEIVKKIIAEEIGGGEGSNFVIKRQITADIADYSIKSALSIFYGLIKNEMNAYWTFLIHTKHRTLIGASPELHVSLKKNSVRMNPISGTYRYPVSGPTLEGIMNFLSTSKEADELYMVVEEELKMLARLCPLGGKIIGPFLKEMSQLAHTEYFIEGKSTCDPITILRETMFAPTVTGSPIENACRIIAKYESKGRGYYSGIATLIGTDLGGYTLDSSILIRTADINREGFVQIGIGATIVRHSDPLMEVAETKAKAKALLQAMQAKEIISVQRAFNSTTSA